MNFYVAARFGKKREVDRLSKKIKSGGHKVISTWIKQKIIKPYNENPEISEKYSKLCLREIEKCDIFVLLSDKEGTGMYFELGFAVHSYINGQRPKIYVIGKYLSRSMFYFLPYIKLLPDIDSVLNDLSR